MLHLLVAELSAAFYQLDKWYFVSAGAEVDFAFVLAEDGDEGVLAVEGGVEEGEGFGGVVAVRVEAVGE